MIKILPKILPSLLSINVGLFILNVVCDCLVLKQFIFCILTNLICWNFNVFVFSAVVPIHLTLHHSAMNTELNIVENLLLAKSFYFLFLPICFYISKVSKQRLVFGHFWLFSQNNQPTLDWKLKNNWTKSLQKLPRKSFTFLN